PVDDSTITGKATRPRCQQIRRQSPLHLDENHTSVVPTPCLCCVPYRYRTNHRLRTSRDSAFLPHLQNLHQLCPLPCTNKCTIPPRPQKKPIRAASCCSGEPSPAYRTTLHDGRPLHPSCDSPPRLFTFAFTRYTHNSPLVLQ
ncbi:unnamed protein product, partial [Ectocarpus sp. 13 AM-2016]